MRYAYDGPSQCTRADAGLDRTCSTGGQSTGQEEDRDRNQQDYALDQEDASWIHLPHYCQMPPSQHCDDRRRKPAHSSKQKTVYQVQHYHQTTTNRSPQKC
jgi:hypothetical protein